MSSKMKIHLLSGFLGSGKTTAIQNACHELMKNQKKVGVITNDQGRTLVDGGLFEHLNIPNRQVVNGCFCCNYNDLDSSLRSLIITNRPDIVFAESVGSCTDIVATVMKPLLNLYPETQITFSTFADIRLLKIFIEGKASSFDESVRYIYFKQLEEAEVIVVSKIDLVDGESLQAIKQLVDRKYGNKILLYQNSFDATDIWQWIHELNNKPSIFPSSLKIDYNIYGAGEGKLAWHDQQIEIYSTTNDALRSAVYIMKSIWQEIHSENYPIGHLKFLLNDAKKISITYDCGEEIFDEIRSGESDFARLLINARVQALSEDLSRIISETLKRTEIMFNSRITISNTSSFYPGFPMPTYRMAD